MSATIMSSSSSYLGPMSSVDALRHDDNVVHTYEYDEERITLQLSRKLEQLRTEKIEPQNAIETEDEAHVNRPSRQLSALRQRQPSESHSLVSPSSSSHSCDDAPHEVPLAPRNSSPQDMPIATAEPSTSVILEAMRRENDSLRRRLVDMERDYVRVVRMNDIYREELIDHRNRLGQPVDSLIGLTGPSVANSPNASFSQVTHMRHRPSVFPTSASTPPVEHRRTASPPNRTVATPIPIHPQASILAAAMGVPIPRSNSNRSPGQQLRNHPIAISTSSSSTEPSSTATTSPSSSLPSPFTFSPPNGSLSYHRSTRTSGSNNYDQDGMAFSSGTQITTPSSNPSPFFAFHLPVIHQNLPLDLNGINQGQGLGSLGQQQLSYPSVPPPSLSSSLGSPIVSRRNSVGPAQGPPTPSTLPGQGSEENVAEAMPRGERTRSNLERGARIAETGSLAGRRRPNDTHVRSSTGTSTRGTAGARSRRTS